jgi:hypothetical protein
MGHTRQWWASYEDEATQPLQQYGKKPVENRFAEACQIIHHIQELYLLSLLSFLRTCREFLVVFLDDRTNQTYMCFMESEFLSGIARTFPLS